MKKLLLGKDILLKIKGNDDSPLSLISIYSDERNNAIEKRRPELAKKGIRPEGPGVNFDGLRKINRAIAKRVSPKDLSKSGKAVFNICINREGMVVYAKYNRSKSTLSDRSSVSDASTAMKKTTFKRDMSAPNKECGQWTIKFTASDK